MGKWLHPRKTVVCNYPCCRTFRGGLTLKLWHNWLWITNSIPHSTVDVISNSCHLLNRYLVKGPMIFRDMIMRCYTCCAHHGLLLEKIQALCNHTLSKVDRSAGCFTNVSWALQNNLAKIHNIRYHISGENVKLKLCTYAQGLCLDFS